MIEDIDVKKIDTNRVTAAFSIRTPKRYLDYFTQAPYDTAAIYLALYRKQKLIRYLASSMTVKDITKPLQNYITSFHFQLPEGVYTCKFAIATCLPGRPSLNSSAFSITIE
jgi:hypothetical protein